MPNQIKSVCREDKIYMDGINYSIAYPESLMGMCREDMSRQLPIVGWHRPENTELNHASASDQNKKEIIKHMGIIVADMSYLTWMIRSLAHARRQGFWIGRNNKTHGDYHCRFVAFLA
jgi:hypothetical protein